MTTRDGTVTGIDRLLAGHAMRFPWYAELLCATRPELPLVDAEVLERHYYHSDLLPAADVYLTSGTSGGARKRIQYCAADDDHYVAQRAALFARFLGPDLPARGAVAVSDLGTGHAAALARRTFAALGMRSHDVDFTRPIHEHVATLDRIRPDVLFTMPMILDRILQADPPLHASPAKIVVVGDLAPPAWRANVAARFGIDAADVLDVVGSIEIGAIAYSDPESGGYLFHDSITAEVLGDDGVVRDHGDGVLLITSTTRDYFPAVRYVTGDLVAGLRRVDGGPVAACDSFRGRVSGDLKHGERISAFDLSQAVARVFPHCPFEVSEGAVLTIRVVTAEVRPAQREQLLTALRTAAPDVATMLDSGLVGAIDVVAVTPEQLRSGPGKRRFDLRDD